MKLIKKIAAMLFAFAMVFSMTGVVQADETTDGFITINIQLKDKPTLFTKS